MRKLVSIYHGRGVVGLYERLCMSEFKDKELIEEFNSISASKEDFVDCVIYLKDMYLVDTKRQFLRVICKDLLDRYHLGALFSKLFNDSLSDLILYIKNTGRQNFAISDTDIMKVYHMPKSYWTDERVVLVFKLILSEENIPIIRVMKNFRSQSFKSMLTRYGFDRVLNISNLSILDVISMGYPDEFRNMVIQDTKDYIAKRKPYTVGIFSGKCADISIKYILQYIAENDYNKISLRELYDNYYITLAFLRKYGLSSYAIINFGGIKNFKKYLLEKVI